MIFDQPLQRATLVRRYKRFLADVIPADGAQTTIHCPNTGGMTGCQGEGWRLWYTDSGNQKRKYPCTWQLVENPAGELICINSGLANRVVKEALLRGEVEALDGFETLRAEVRYGEQGSRIDFLLEYPAEADSVEGKRCYLEVKSLTLGLGEGLGVFPDAVTTRGQKHLQELIAVRGRGDRAALLFCVQHTGVQRVSVARSVDPVYADLLERAVAAGVEVMAYAVTIDPAQSEIRLSGALPFSLSA